MLKLQDKLLSNTQYYIERAAKLGVPKGNFVQGGGAATVEAAEGVDGANQAALAQQLKDAQDKLASVQHELESANEMVGSGRLSVVWLLPFDPVLRDCVMALGCQGQPGQARPPPS